MSLRRIAEQHTFTREELEAVAKNMARGRIMANGIYIGTYHTQTAEWRDDGSIVVVTEHTPADWADWSEQK